MSCTSLLLFVSKNKELEKICYIHFLSISLERFFPLPSHLTWLWESPVVSTQNTHTTTELTCLFHHFHHVSLPSSCLLLFFLSQLTFHRPQAIPWHMKCFHIKNIHSKQKVFTICIYLIAAGMFACFFFFRTKKNKLRKLFQVTRTISIFVCI